MKKEPNDTNIILKNAHSVDGSMTAGLSGLGYATCVAGQPQAYFGIEDRCREHNSRYQKD